MRHDLVIIGAGSGNTIVDDSFGDLDVAIVEQDLFGGTCLNRGCIPSKMLAYTAEVAGTVRTAGRYDVDARLDGVRWPDVVDRVFDRLDPSAADGKNGREDSDFVTVYTGTARFTGARRLTIDTEDGPTEVEAGQVVLATGSRPVVPPVVADSGLPYETSDTIMRIAEPPRRLAVLGGGYVAVELAQVFAETGAEVTIVEQADTLLGPQDETVSVRFTDLARKRFDLRLGAELKMLGGEPGGALRLTLYDGAVIEADTLLVAVGRIPNGDRLGLPAAGIDVHDDGRIVVDRYQRTTAEGVFALGDACTPKPLKHVANREAAAVKHNLRHPGELISAEHDVIPAAVFAQPQIASVGATEQECRDQGKDYVVGCADYSATAYGWAIEDETSFCKVLADRRTGLILGAHIMGPQAATLIQPLVLAMSTGITARTVALTPYWIHPAPTEVVENALRALDLDLG